MIHVTDSHTEIIWNAYKKKIIVFKNKFSETNFPKDIN